MERIRQKRGVYGSGLIPEHPISVNGTGMNLSVETCVFIDLLGLIVLAANTSRAEDPPFTLDELRSRTFELAEKYFEQSSWHPKSHALRQRFRCRPSTGRRRRKRSRLANRHRGDTGRGSRTPRLHCGHTLIALLDAYDAAPDPYLRTKAEQLYLAPKFIGEAIQSKGNVPRGPHPNDPSAYYDDSSMDQ